MQKFQLYDIIWAIPPSFGSEYSDGKTRPNLIIGILADNYYITCPITAGQQRTDKFLAPDKDAGIYKWSTLSLNCSIKTKAEDWWEDALGSYLSDENTKATNAYIAARCKPEMRGKSKCFPKMAKPSFLTKGIIK